MDKSKKKGSLNSVSINEEMIEGAKMLVSTGISTPWLFEMHFESELNDEFNLSQDEISSLATEIFCHPKIQKSAFLYYVTSLPMIHHFVDEYIDEALNNTDSRLSEREISVRLSKKIIKEMTEFNTEPVVDEGLLQQLDDFIYKQLIYKKYYK